MADDLLVQLLDSWIANGKMPDEMSIKYGNDSRGEDNDDAVICFQWNTGKERIYGHTDARYSAVWYKFNTYWGTREIA